MRKFAANLQNDRAEIDQCSASTLAPLPFGIFAPTLELHYDVGGFYRSKTKSEALEVP
jgi:hypothetical protein